MAHYLLIPSVQTSRYTPIYTRTADKEIVGEPYN